MRYFGRIIIQCYPTTAPRSDPVGNVKRRSFPFVRSPFRFVGGRPCDPCDGSEVQTLSAGPFLRRPFSNRSVVIHAGLSPLDRPGCSKFNCLRTIHSTPHAPPGMRPGLASWFARRCRVQKMELRKIHVRKTQKPRSAREWFLLCVALKGNGIMLSAEFGKIRSSMACAAASPYVFLCLARRPRRKFSRVESPPRDRFFSFLPFSRG